MPKKRKTKDAKEFFIGTHMPNPLRDVMEETWHQFREFLESENPTLEKSGVGVPLRALLAENPQALMMVFGSGFVSGVDLMTEVMQQAMQAQQQQAWKDQNRVNASKVGRA